MQTLPNDSSVTFPAIRDSLFDPPLPMMDIRGQSDIHPMRFANGADGWLVSSMEIGRGVLRDPRFSTQDQRSLPVAKPSQIAADGSVGPSLVEIALASRETAPETLQFIFLDPPDHTVFRRLLSPHLSPKRITNYRADIERIVAEQLDALAEAGPGADFVELFGTPVPLRTICRVLGLDESRIPEWQRPAELAEDGTSDLDSAAGALSDLADALRIVLDEKRAHPEDDLLSVVAVSDLTETDMVAVAGFLLQAGFTTTASMLGLAVLALLEHRTRWEMLKADPSLTPDAVEELLRYLTIFQVGAMTRTALEDVTISGVEIRRGDPVFVSLALANRDARAFKNPDNLDLTRDAFGHLAFGYGIHQCLGQHLARLELTIAIEALLKRFPDLDLAIPLNSVQMRPGHSDFHGMVKLPLTWSTNEYRH